MQSRAVFVIVFIVTLLAGCGSGKSGDLKALTSDCMASTAIDGTLTGGTALQNDRTEQHGKVVPAGLVRSLPLAEGSSEDTVLTAARAKATGCGWSFEANTSQTRLQGTKTLEGDSLKLALSFQGDPGGRFLVIDLSNQGN